MRFIILIICFALIGARVAAQDLAADASAFISTLSNEQKKLTLFPFASDERYNFHYFPIDDRKGLPIGDMSKAQKDAAFKLLNNALTDATIKKVHEIIELEVLLKELENRGPDDHFRDPAKYFLAIFGTPGANEIWGWRFEGHHVSFNFSSQNNTIVSGTPGFLGSNPAIVPQGPDKGKEILKEERETGLAFVHSLSKEQLKTAFISDDAPGEILTGNKRKAIIDDPKGISYSQLNASQQKKFIELVNLYITRYKKPFAQTMMDDIKKAGFDKLKFAWAGHMQTGPGHPHYYRITGPTIIIEYDNTQNNANHVHTVVRDLLRDYGGDELMKHYKEKHSH